MTPRSLESYESQILALHKTTPFRDFVRDIASWQPVAFYKNNGVISRYSDSPRIGELVSLDEFEELRDGFLKQGLLPLIEGSFFQKFRTLFRSTPQPVIMGANTRENSDFTDNSGNTKNAYLTFIADNGENIFYSFSVKSSSNVYGSVAVWDHCENVYSSSGIATSSYIFYSRYLTGCSNVWFSRNLVGCQECIFCEGLQNQNYCINNVKYPKEIYMEKKAEFLKSRDTFESWYARMPKDSKNLSSHNVSGTFVMLSENVENGFWIANVKDARNTVLTGGRLEKMRLFDTVICGANSDMCATLHGANGAEYVFCSISIYHSTHIYHSYYLEGCNFCLGCMGLKNQSFCIFNVQYSKEEWYEKVFDIFDQMKQMGEFGKFFPADLCPHYFNDTLASLIQDFSEEEAKEAGYLWRDEPIRVDIPNTAEIIETKDLSSFQGYDTEGKWEIREEILGKVIVDQNGNFYKILPMELEFLRKYSLPLPTLHWLDRIRGGFRM